MKRIFRGALLLMVLFHTVGGLRAANNDMKLWYDRPASLWVEALPLGNGAIGAMVFGDPVNEQFQLNEETVWGGSPLQQYQSQGQRLARRDTPIDF